MLGIGKEVCDCALRILSLWSLLHLQTLKARPHGIVKSRLYLESSLRIQIPRWHLRPAAWWALRMGPLEIATNFPGDTLLWEWLGKTMFSVKRSSFPAVSWKIYMVCLGINYGKGSFDISHSHRALKKMNWWWLQKNYRDFIFFTV